MMRSIHLAALALLATASPAFAEGMRIEPGQWEFTTTSPGAMGGPPTKKVRTECIRDDSMTPQRFTAELKGCQISDPKSDDTSMSWKMSCPSPAGSMNGTGSFRSSGSTVSGTLEMTRKMGAQEFPMTNNWSGRRLGACQ